MSSPKARHRARAPTETPWTLQAVAASRGRRRARTTRLNQVKPTMSNSKNQDDVDDEITAVFAEGEPGEDGMSKSWHGSRSARFSTLSLIYFSTFPNILHFSQKSLSFFVDISGAESPGPPPALTRSTFISPSSTYPSFYQVPSHILNFNTLQKPSFEIFVSLLMNPSQSPSVLRFWNMILFLKM